MSTIPINSKISLELEAIINGISTLDTPTLERFASKVNQLVTQRKIPTLSPKEAELLLKINEGLPEKIQVRYRELMDKSFDETLTDMEHKEYLKLIPQVESKDVERLRYLVELANLWEMSVDDVMEKLGIKAPPTNG